MSFSITVTKIPNLYRVITWIWTLLFSRTHLQCAPGTHTKYKIKPMTMESSRQGTLRHAINKHRAMSLAPWFSECISLSTDPKGSTSGGLISVCWDQELWKTTNRNVEIQPQIWDEPSFSNDLRVLLLYHRHIVSLGRKLVAVNQNQEIDIFSNVVGLKGFKRQWRLFRRCYPLCCKSDDFSRLSYKVFVVSLPLLY